MSGPIPEPDLRALDHQERHESQRDKDNMDKRAQVPPRLDIGDMAKTGRECLRAKEYHGAEDAFVAIEEAWDEVKESL